MSSTRPPPPVGLDRWRRLVRALVQEEPVQAEIASALLSRAEQVAIPLPVFCELVWVLRRVYGFTAADCTTVIEALIASRTVMADRPAVGAGLQLLASAGDFADGVIAFGGRQLGSERFATFDRAAAQLLSDAGELIELL